MDRSSRIIKPYESDRLIIGPRDYLTEIYLIGLNRNADGLSGYALTTLLPARLLYLVPVGLSSLADHSTEYYQTHAK